MTLKKRAYSDEEKQQREEMIIDAAQQLLMEKSFHSINMSEIARTANLAKGTVYLYFQTKEELFLTLFERQFGQWLEDVEAQLKRLSPPVEKDAVVDILVQATSQNRQLVRLTALTNIIFEHNISYDKAKDYKQWLVDQVAYFSTILEPLLNLEPEQGIQFMYRFYIFVVGLESIANPAPIAQEVYAKNPSLGHPDFETELAALISMTIDAL